MQGLILWLAFVALAINFLVSLTVHLMCIRQFGWQWVRDGVFDFIVLAATVIVEIYILTQIY